jgi:hypothetical protein
MLLSFRWEGAGEKAVECTALQTLSRGNKRQGHGVRRQSEARRRFASKFQTHNPRPEFQAIAGAPLRFAPALQTAALSIPHTLAAGTTGSPLTF